MSRPRPFPLPAAALPLALAIALAPASASAAPPHAEPPARAQRPWLHRWSPERNTGELGVFAGVLAPSRSIELFEPRRGAPPEGFRRFASVAPMLGARGGFYPSRFFGVELEGAIAPTRTNDGDAASLWTARGQLVGQLGLWSITPFLAVGAGAFGVASRRGAVGHDTDASLHVGGGVKVFLSRHLGMRLDVRDVISHARGLGAAPANSVEALLGLTLTLGRAKDPRPSAPSPQRAAAAAPVGDLDGDGLVDPEDACPREPETVNAYVDADGCPDTLPVAVAPFAGVIEGIGFDTDSATITAESLPVLDAAVTALAQHAAVRVRILGHTDDVGPREHNMDLSRRRAEAVASYLVDHGIDPERIETRGVGPHFPLASNDDELGRARNRRIEFQLITPTEAP